jgi:hypothetical protein
MQATASQYTLATKLWVSVRDILAAELPSSFQPAEGHLNQPPAVDHTPIEARLGFSELLPPSIMHTLHVRA